MKDEEANKRERRRGRRVEDYVRNEKVGQVEVVLIRRFRQRS